MVKKTTHTILDVEGLMYELIEKIKNAETKTEKHALIKKLKSLEKHYNDCNEKNINGKKYPERMYHSDTKPMDKEEVLKLIKDVECDVPVEIQITTKDYIKSEEYDLSGILTPDARAEMSNL